MDLTGNVVFITGSAQGIGKSYADNLLKNHAKVMISDVNKTAGEESEKELAKKYGKDNVKFITCDVTNDDQFEDCIKETIRIFGKLDILINNAGIALEIEPHWKKTININFAGLVRGTYLGLKYMGKDVGHNGGTIVNIASVTSFEPVEFVPVYSATKSAINQFSRSMGAKLHYDLTGVKVITLNPGMTDTAIPNDSGLHLRPEHKEEFERQKKTRWIMQSVEHMGAGLIDVLRKAKSGEMWVIENGKPAKRFDFIVQKYDE
ncbi:hypothetical protein O3M35_011555 [Rhynocoris fuscipes]|uniref:15-hydroxyprostaglandin dehydrogenase [NAD(+)] n=1 Tax=Rhynocoris fuscipes TaxID=488301 RepID=A0AAW1D162_9HEMI